ncbi:hypothetical protein [Streptomyces sp. NPDC054961]
MGPKGIAASRTPEPPPRSRSAAPARGERPVLGGLYEHLSARARELGLFDGRQRSVRRPPMDVSSGRGFVFVSHTGEVHPSGFLPVSAGSVKNHALTDIYRGSALFTTLRDPRGKRGACEFRTVGGGSRSRASGFTDDVLEADPYRAYEPGSFPHQEDLRALAESTRR